MISVNAGNTAYTNTLIFMEPVVRWGDWLFVWPSFLLPLCGLVRCCDTLCCRRAL